ncbi:hypothetical protein [Roseateles toxinivorans]|uniref:Uncharacterized protein n=1 Tax=Roseateles toxinivorans TaxID=270368 RepID=A0A4V3CSN6_9BURK|nr:hypothetical protein [Roseateles toxinivorans]TDP61365.1 hypothetical protein DES47_11348 [Roseateles toxinivorans]
MRILQPPGRALNLAQGEMAIAVSPKLAGRVDADGQRRMNAFAGRALTDALLHAEQDHRSRRLALLQQALSAGVVEGLGLSLDLGGAAPVDLSTARGATLDSGLALAASGEEVVVPQALHFDLLDLPVWAPGWLLAGEAPPPGPGEADGTVLESRHLGRSLREELTAGMALPRAGIVVLEPIEHYAIEGVDPFDQCERDLDAEAFEDQLRQDAGRLVWYAWPDEWLSLPAADATWRNRLAYRVFDREARLGSAQAMPWNGLGIPLALVGFDTVWQPLFADGSTVVRSGGRPRARQGSSGAGDRFLWQARIEQLAEQITEARQAGTDTAALGAQLPMLPPAGLLPADAIDVRATLNRFFSSQLDVFAAPVPLEQLDLLLEESAGLAPIDTSVRERLAVYVPVPQALFDPQLLVVERPDADGTIVAALNRFIDARSDWLRRRQNLRDKQLLQRRGLDGANVKPPPAEDPQRLEDEASAPQQPPPAGLLHRSALAQGMHQHVLEQAATPLRPADGASLYAWVQLDREHPPQQLMLQFNVNGWEHRAYWGVSRLNWGTEGTASRKQQSAELPTAGSWVRLTVPAADLGLVDRDISGLAFTLFGGRACFGPLGLLQGEREAPWLTQQLLDGAGKRWGDGEDWDLVDAQDRDAPFEASLGTSVQGETRRLAGLAELLASADVKGLKITPTVVKPGTPAGEFVTLAALLEEQGLRHMAADLAFRIAQADDVINLGYLRSQTDLYRLRQSVLKQTQATRFAVSPALTQIADLDNASATREQLADFYQTIKADKTVLKRETAPREVPGAQPAGLNVAGLGLDKVSTPIFGGGTRELPDKLIQREALRDVGGLFTKGSAATPPPVDDSDALTGKAEIRTTSIAARMERPRSIEAKDNTVATRHEVVAKLLALGLDMGDLEVTGLPAIKDVGNENERLYDKLTGQPHRTGIKKLADLKQDLSVLLNDRDPDPERSDESTFFYSGVDLSDHTIALLRRAEGVVRRYRNVLERCRAVIGTTEQWLAQTTARIAVVERELAEARQDVATARALMAEEVERARSLNERRDQVIAQHVKFLAYARVRVLQRSVGTQLAAPVRELESSLEPDAVPACLADHEDPPEDVAAMLQVLRRAPVDWFPALRPHLQLIDRPLLADRLIATLRPAVATQLSFTAMASTAVMQASFSAVQAHAEQVQQVRAVALPQLQATLSSGAALASKIALIGKAASIADLLAAAAERGELQRRVAAEFERMAAIAGCLHARLSGVRAGIRLEWAERFSQFDGRQDLGDLTGLPRFDELPRDDREDIRELAVWLIGRVDRSNARAVALMADLLRVCLLAASHSPVGEIISGRIIKPVPLNPGIRLDVRPLLPQKVRLGMAVQLFEAGQVSAHAVVEDLVDGVAALRITQTLVANVQTSLATAVHFINR